MGTEKHWAAGVRLHMVILNSYRLLILFEENHCILEIQKKDLHHRQLYFFTLVLVT